ncbi:MAG: AMP-binding protein [Oscillospiraceae bacterium]|nr:AMP-binding protein [Oscillospiraceae bacterium]
MYGKPYPLYEVEQLSNLKEVINHIASKYGDKTAFTFERNDETVNISFNQFKADVEALGTAFIDMDITNMKVGLLGDNSYEWLLIYFAMVNTGNIIVPLDKLLPAAEVKSLIDHCGAEVFVSSNTYVDYIDYLRNNNETVQHYFSMDNIYDFVKKGKELIKQGDLRYESKAINNDVLMALMYTSGTTGNPKGVMLSHKNISKCVENSLKYIKFWDSTLLVLPLHHVSGFVGTLGMLVSGCRVAINTSLKTLPSDFAKYKPRVIILVPLFIETLYKQILGAASGNTDDAVLKQIAGKVFGGNLEMILCGAAPIDKKYVNYYLDFGIDLLQSYALTESVAIVAVNRNNYNLAGSSGLVIPNCEVKIVDPDENGNGEILTKSEFTMLGYYKNEQATAETIEDGWLKTGDIGYIDEDGFLFISGRKKNLIVLSNGKNVYPEEIEFDLKNTPLLKEVVVREDTSAQGSTDVIIAEIFPDFDMANKQGIDDLQEHFDKTIAAYNKTTSVFKRIQRVILRDTEFPKTTTKKIKRNVEG